MVQLEYSVEEPLNREPELETLVSSFITQPGTGYDRNHGPIPHISTSTHRVSVSGLVHDGLSLSVADLASLPQHSVICALQCAGNRRHTMRTKLKEVNGIDWFDGAVMNCKWTGPLLSDVLSRAKLDVEKEKWEDAHVAFACHQTPCQDDDFYGASIPLSRAMDPGSSIILALQMNGEPLPPNHGAPVRVVTPGIAGARSVKWLDRITVQMCESSSYYQQHDYKILPPEADSKEKAEEWWGKVSALQDMPINSVIGVPKSDSTVKRDEDGRIQVKGYALPSGAEGPITKVEVSVDGGKTWTDAELIKGQDEAEATEADLRWAWTLWNAKVKVDEGKDVRVLSRATDKSGSTQAEHPVWNFRGVGYNGYGEVSGLEVI
ncbi:sulfite oxidase-like protein [Dothidotthia symphoricarpi CBS 119687]|uniref:Sulfite oxidase-like protein n=1 Tax=Dothidotthia symphoricarpi CBS 119687 TaxID=1392245 RepID=A0A6A6A000_9PLEO|nr:sulfite oxidase-like protein [Dothidotthia symphoricarpi CBS 119687]KAF2125332.1 sulfite oxidase-like protein [Dothidotthia symphoricarpi CBS 119687]